MVVTILLAAALLGWGILALLRMRKSKGCGCGCSGCTMAGHCGKNKA